MFWRVTLATGWRLVSVVKIACFAKMRQFFLLKKKKQNPFSVFPQSFVTIHCLLCLNLLKRHIIHTQTLLNLSLSLHQSSSKGMDFVSFSMCSSYLALYLLDCVVFVILFYTCYLNMGIHFLLIIICSLVDSVIFHST